MRQRKYMLKAFLSLILIVVTYFGYNIWNALQTKKNISANIQQLPKIALQQLDGSLINLDIFRTNDKLLVLNYFNPDCDHCQNMVKELIHESARLNKVQWLMISTEKLETIRSFAGNMNLSKLSAVTLLRDTSFEFEKRFGMQSIPSFYVYSYGQLIRKHNGECSIEYLLQ